MQYARIWADGSGESHFEDVSVDVAPVDFAPPAPPLNLGKPMPTERMLFCNAPSTWVAGWHPAPRRQFFFQLSGRLQVTVSDGEVREFSAGSLVLLDDTSGKGHITKAIGGEEVDAVFVQVP